MVNSPHLFQEGFALLIGVGYCTDMNLSLPGTANDACTVQSVLKDPERCGYPNEQVCLVVNDDIGANNASKKGILNGLYWLKDHTSSTSTVVVYFSGHGMLKFATQSNGKETFYLIPGDCDLNNVSETAISIKELSDALRPIKSQKMLIILDCCHAGGFNAIKGEDLLLPSTFENFADPDQIYSQLGKDRGCAILFSCDKNQSSWLMMDRKSSIFTHYLVEALQGTASAAGESAIPLSRIIGHISQKVPTTVRECYGVEKVQSPQIKWEGSDFVVAFAPKEKESESTIPLSKQEIDNRQWLLDRVYNFWIRKELTQILQGDDFISLELHEKPDAVINPLVRASVKGNQSEKPLPRNITIKQVYENAQGQLLLLGDAGVGKTTLLLALTHDLLEQARANISRKLPVLFKISSWGASQQIFSHWLIEELNRMYEIPHSLGRTWVDQDQILPLLDGLDEVPSEHLSECIDAINTYRKEHGMLPIIISSRTQEYLTQEKRLRLHTAVIIQPLTTQQIDAYLIRVKGMHPSVREVLRQDLQQPATTVTPLMLNILTSNYRDKLVDDLQQIVSVESEYKQMFDVYIENMYQRYRGVSLYTSYHTKRHLTWLAQQMIKHSETVYYIERTQLDWLIESKRQACYNFTTKSIYGIVGIISGILFGILHILGGGRLGKDMSVTSTTKLFGWMDNGMGDKISSITGFGLIIMVISILVSILVSKMDIEKEQSETRSWSQVIRHATNGLVGGLLGGVIIGLITYFLISGVSGFKNGIDTSIVYGLLGTLILGLDSFFGANSFKGLFFILKDFKKYSLYNSISYSITGGITYGVLNWMILGSHDALGGIIIGASAGLLIMLSGEAYKIDSEIKPPDIVNWSSAHMWRGFINIRGKSIITSITVATTVAFFFFLISTHFNGFEYGVVYGLVYGVIIGIVAGIAVALVGGLKGGYSSEILKSRHIQPNQGIWYAWRNSRRVGLAVGLAGGFVNGFVVGTAFTLIIGLQSGIFLGLIAAIISGIIYGLFFGLLYGGTACVQHIVLRCFLRIFHHVPLNYPFFLNYCTELILLRKVGGGYTFEHPLLMKHFAMLDNNDEENKRV